LLLTSLMPSMPLIFWHSHSSGKTVYIILTLGVVVGVDLSCYSTSSEDGDCYEPSRNRNLHFVRMGNFDSIVRYRTRSADKGENSNWHENLEAVWLSNRIRKIDWINPERSDKTLDRDFVWEGNCGAWYTEFVWRLSVPCSLRLSLQEWRSYIGLTYTTRNDLSHTSWVR